MLRPTELGLTGVKRPLSHYKELLGNNIIRLLRIQGRQQKIASVCLEIMSTSPGSRVKIEGMYPSDFSEINSHFGSVIGPVLCYEAGLIPELKPHDHVYITPSSGENYDFKVYLGNKPMLIRHRPKRIVLNPMYPEDITRKINVESDLGRVWRDTIPFKVISELNEYSPVLGAVLAVSRYYPKITNIRPQEYSTLIRQLTRPNAVIENPPDSLLELISETHEIDDDSEIDGELVQETFERLLVEQSKADPTYSELYMDVSEARIKVLHFKLDRNGAWNAQLVEEENMIDMTQDITRDRNDKMYLTKNGFVA